ncbi:c-type cytochrome [Ramlibacter sp. G-1-2-2]|uniref:C-type cytochrome n=1 Tax=Ramlibacter agri TaxID=2728837 RepID=A0A848GZC8_9BURK|nr:c-type cytochrome [Ramlibacter agri]NML42741.1 c-type cytochrome [Ramlibacter agri]
MAKRSGGRALRGLVAVLVVVALAAFALAWKPAIDPIQPPARGTFDPALIKAGARVATLGNCISCHTGADGPPFAGSRAVPTPFGTIFSTNISPDAETGIGQWSEAAFLRALREGVARDGHLLYPAFPYDHFTRMRDGDIHSLYAYLMTREPVRRNAPANQLVFPLQFRPLIAGWNLLFLEVGPQKDLPTQSPEWNRGAYVVDALAHCSACHSPRNRLGAEDLARRFDGGEAEGWHAAALNQRSPSPVVWTAETLAAYLRTGLAPEHGMAAGPMQDVVRSVAQADPADAQAIATYIAAGMQPVDPERRAREQAVRQKAQAPLALDDSPGARLYADNCASCHDAGRGLSSNAALRLPLAVALYLPDARNLLRIMRQGIQPTPGKPGRWMPPFEGNLSEDELSTLARWLRQNVAGQPAWADLPQSIAATRPPKP